MSDSSKPPAACEPEHVDRSDPSRWPQASTSPMPTMLGVVAERQPLSALTPPAPPSRPGRSSRRKPIDPDDPKSIETALDRLDWRRS
jgi:hypothetical protein